MRRVTMLTVAIYPDQLRVGVLESGLVRTWGICKWIRRSFHLVTRFLIYSFPAYRSLTNRGTKHVAPKSQSESMGVCHLHRSISLQVGPGAIYNVEIGRIATLLNP